MLTIAKTEQWRSQNQTAATCLWCNTHIETDDRSELPLRPLIEKVETDPCRTQITLLLAPDPPAKQGKEGESLGLS